MVEYADALVVTKPLRDEVTGLEADLATTRAAYDAAMALVHLGSAEGIAAMKRTLEEQKQANAAAAAEKARLVAELPTTQSERDRLVETRQLREEELAAEKVRQQAELVAEAETKAREIAEEEAAADAAAEAERVRLAEELVAERAAAVAGLRAERAVLEAGLAAEKALLEGELSVGRERLEAELPDEVGREELVAQLETLQNDIVKRLWESFDVDGNNVRALCGWHAATHAVLPASTSCLVSCAGTCSGAGQIRAGRAAQAAGPSQAGRRSDGGG